MKDTVTIPKWTYVMLMAIMLLNVFEFVFENVVEKPVYDKPVIHIYHHD